MTVPDPIADRASAGAVLAARARALAQLPAPDTDPRSLELLCLTLAGERYAIETRYIREVRPLAAITPLPGLPGFFAGITNVHGGIVAVIDLAGFFGLPRTAPPTRLVVCGESAAEFAIVADTVDDVGRVPHGEVLAAPHDDRPGASHCRGVTRDALVVLDGAALLAEPRFIVDDGQS